MACRLGMRLMSTDAGLQAEQTEQRVAPIYVDKRKEGNRQEEIQSSEMEPYIGRLTFDVRRDTAQTIKDRLMQTREFGLLDHHFGLMMKKTIRRGSLDAYEALVEPKEDTRGWVILDGNSALYDTKQPESWRKVLDYSFRLFPLCKNATFVDACMVCNALLNIEPIILDKKS